MARVLIVDDDEGLLDTSQAVLRDAGFDVLVAASGREALEALQGEACEVVLTDLKLPDLGGLDLLRQIHESGLDLSAVVMTGYPSTESAGEAKALGALEYLVKPVFEDELVEAVKRAWTVRGIERRSTVRADGLARWADAVCAVLDAEHDPRVEFEWADLLGVALDTLRGWSRTTGLPLKSSLDLARVLRAVRQARRRGGSPRWFLRVLHPRTAGRLLEIAGVTQTDPIPTLNEVLAGQTFVTDPVALDELRRRLVESGVDLED